MSNEGIGFNFGVSTKITVCSIGNQTDQAKVNLDLRA
jgi:hypothetical protein